MSERDCKEFFWKYLRDKSEVDDQIIYKNKLLYDKAYDTICLLIDAEIVSNVSDFDRVLCSVNKQIHRRFMDKFKEKSPGKKLYIF